MRKSAPLFCALLLSLSVRRAWIEIILLRVLQFFALVALRKESVDRNFDIRHTTSTRPRSLSVRRAWIEISVARYKPTPKPSLSVRRAWIEIRGARPIGCKCPVALRKESVDRNCYAIFCDFAVQKSLSVRRAWIEMRKITITVDDATSLSVRRAWIEMVVPLMYN